MCVEEEEVRRGGENAGKKGDKKCRGGLALRNDSSDVVVKVGRWDEGAGKRETE